MSKKRGSKKRQSKPRKKSVREKWDVSKVKKANVELTGEIQVKMRCLACGEVWDVQLLENGGFSENYTECPRGCNMQKENN